MMEEKAKKIAELLKILANENRLLILCALIESPLTVGNIYAYTSNITLSALSQHLNYLKIAGILDSKKIGLHVVYSIIDKNVIALIDTLKEQYCNP